MEETSFVERVKHHESMWDNLTKEKDRGSDLTHRELLSRPLTNYNKDRISLSKKLTDIYI